MESSDCAHKDVRRFDNLQCCMECGETLILCRPSRTLPTSPFKSAPVSPGISHFYDDIRLSTDQKIRLLIVAPGGPADPIWCTIVTVDLNPIPKYEALSYTWATEDGDCQKTGRVHCPAGVIPVTENCETALRKLRLPKSPRTLWVDAVSINQSNISERNHQVGLMDQVYRNATAVVVFICHPEFTSDCFWGGRWPEYLKGNRASVIKQFSELCKRRYFQRVWIIQEILLAQTLTFHINDHERVLIMGDLRRNVLPLYNQGEFDIPSVLLYRETRGPKTVMEYLQLSMAASCLDPRDKIYGILSLLPERTRLLIPVDYSLGYSQVLQHAVMACIDDCQDLSILHYKRNWTSMPVDPTHVEEEEAFNLIATDFDAFLTWRTSKQWLDDCQRYYGDTWNEKMSSPWIRSVRVRLSDEDKDHRYVNSHSAVRISTVVVIPAIFPEHQILPRMRLRAHLIDISHGHASMYSPSKLSRRPLDCTINSWRPDVPKTVEERFKQCPIIPYNAYEAYTSGAQTENGTIPPRENSNVNYWDLHRYFSVDFDSKKQSRHGFLTHYSIGITDIPHLPGDHIFALDGLIGPIILRPSSPGVYRIIGPCYVWAAMELEYWNPGTYKGLWPERPVDLGEQTRIIEIY